MSPLTTLLLISGTCLASTKVDFSRAPDVDQNSLMREEAFLTSLLTPLIPTGEQTPSHDVFRDRDSDFFLYTREDPGNYGYLLVANRDNVRESNFDVNRETKVIIHGWTDSSEEPWVQEMRKQYLEVGDYNVICVNWYPGSSTEYLFAVNLTKKVAEQLAILLNFLRTELKMSLAKVHLVGHSLGAQIAGFTGDYLGGRIGRITGMDPAKPLFENLILQNTNEYLELSDAIFVDIIHTCSGTLGFSSTIGHVDFYPNGGFAAQPGCPILLSQSCSHERAYRYMIESIKYPKAFFAVRCNNWWSYIFGYCRDYSDTEYMGEWVDRRAQGSYFLTTNPSYPFGRGQHFADRNLIGNFNNEEQMIKSEQINDS